MKTKILADFQICISVPFKCSFSVWRKYFQMNSIIFIRSLTELIDMSCLLSKVKLRNIENFLIKYLWSLLTSLVLKSLLYIQVIFANSFTYPLLWILWFLFHLSTSKNPSKCNANSSKRITFNKCLIYHQSLHNICSRNSFLILLNKKYNLL